MCKVGPCYANRVIGSLNKKGLSQAILVTGSGSLTGLLCGLRYVSGITHWFVALILTRLTVIVLYPLNCQARLSTMSESTVTMPDKKLFGDGNGTGSGSSPQLTHLGIPGTHHRVLSKEDPGYVAATFEGKLKQMKEGKLPSLGSLSAFRRFRCRRNLTLPPSDGPPGRERGNPDRFRLLGDNLVL
jgi:hypothetical protein